MVSSSVAGTIDPVAPPRPGHAPPAFHLLAKPTGAICNLGCAYCFFLDKELLYPGSRRPRRCRQHRPTAWTTSWRSSSAWDS